MSINIKIIQKLKVNNTECIKCFIKISNTSLEEYFLMSLNFWTLENYVNNWLYSLKKALISKEENRIIVLPTNMSGELKNLNFFKAWVIYINGHNVFLQEHMVLAEYFKTDNFLELEKCILPREQYSEDGGKISEWECSLKDLDNLYHDLLIIDL
jgi:hypothetical protein